MLSSVASALGYLGKKRVLEKRLLRFVYSDPQVKREVLQKLCSSIIREQKKNGQLKILTGYTF